MTSSKLTLFWLCIGCSLSALACGKKIEPMFMQHTTADVDTNTTADVDTNTSTDLDTDTSTEDALTFDVFAGGYIEADPWHGYIDNWTTGDGSTISPKTFDDIQNDDSLCVMGNISAMPDWSGTALITMTINEDAERTSAETWAPKVPETEGIYVDVSNPGKTELRVQIESGGSRWCAVIDKSGGTFIQWSLFNTHCWDNSGAYYAGEPIAKVGVLMPGHNRDDRPYHYCIEEMYPVTGYEEPIDTDVDTGDAIDTAIIPANWRTGYVGEHGSLQAQDGTLVDENKNEIVLRGLSLFWSHWGGKYFTKEVVDWLLTDWNTNVIRAPLSVYDNLYGYLASPTYERKKVTTVINAAIEAGAYVIIDWHDHNASDHPYDARAFFESMAKTYGAYPNVIYEIWNEPLPQHDWAGTIKPYADFVIEGIREHDPDNLILVGTTSWAQQVEDPVSAPIDDPNVAYVMHFYVGQHTGTLRVRTESAKEAGLTVFISEWGIWNGAYIMPEDTDMEEWEGEVDTEQVAEWLNWADEQKLSMCMWSVFDKEEPSAILKPGASTSGNWTADDLTTAGTYMHNIFNSYEY